MVNREDILCDPLSGDKIIEDCPGALTSITFPISSRLLTG